MKKRVLPITILALLLILVASAAVASAGRATTQNAPGLEGVRWVLASYKDAQGKTATALPDVTVSAEFAGGRVAGSAGCNSYTAAYQVDGNKLTVGKAVSTMMMCAEPVMGQEQAYLANLQAAATYKVDGEQLTISDAGGAVVLTYKGAKGTPLVATNWLMTMYNNGRGGFQSAMAGVDVTAVFDDKGQLSGNGGCNTYSGPYTVDGAKIKIGPLASTMKACDQAVMDQEAAYLAALGNAATFKIEGTSLTLRDAQGAAMAGYIQSAPAPAAGAAAKAGAILPKGDRAYVSLQRAASGGGVRSVLMRLKADGTAEFTTDFGKDTAIVESGKWEENNGAVTVTLTDKGGTKYDKPVVLAFKRDKTFLNLVDFDKAVWGEAGLKLNLASDIARRLRTSLATLDLSAGFPLDPTFMSAFAGGGVDASLLGKGCAGYINQSPVATVKWNGKADQLRAFFYSDGDPTLVVLTPKGELLCNDNASGQILDPFVEVKNPAPGEYRIWVGSAQKDNLIPGVLVMTTKPTVDLGTFNLGTLVKRPVVPQTVEQAAPSAATLAPNIKALADKLTASAPELKPGANVTVDVTADGNIPLFRIPAAADNGCAGLVNGAPGYAFKWSGAANNLHLGFAGDGDSTLMVVATGSKQVWCNDDAKSGSTNPAIDIPTPADDLYLVYVGRVSPAKPVTGKLTVADAAKE